MKKLTIAVKPESMEDVTSFIEKELRNYSRNFQISFKIMVAIDEIYSNIIKYSGADMAEITIEKYDGILYITFSDNGKPFNPLEKKEPDMELPLDEMPIGGLGLYIVKKSMDDVKYQYQNNQNKLILCLNIAK